MLEAVLLAFIPIFVAVDAVGVLPIFVFLTEGINKEEKNRVIFQSVVTASCLALGFIFLGRAIFKFLRITMGDFMVAGGAILFCIAMMDIIFPGKKRRLPAKDVGAVPIGTPLIVGPAVLTTSLALMQEYGGAATIIAVLMNIFIAGIIFSLSKFLIKLLGQSGTRALSKVMSLLLAAIAVMMMRKGIIYIFSQL